MAISLTPEQRQLGQENFARVSEGLTRRRFMKGVAVAAGAAIPAGAAYYFGYKGMDGKPVKAALIGGGDEGGVLVGEHNPEFLEFVAVCDIRPYNLDIRADGKHGGRIFDGDPKVALRKGFRKVYGSRANNIKPYRKVEDMLRSHPEIEAVVIATPLVTHAPIAMQCMRFGQQRGKPIHVLTEKLMARRIRDCKEMIAVAKETGSILSVGHQRHYSLLYAHAVDVIEAGILGEIKHISASWHRNFSWPEKEEKDGPKLAEIPNALAELHDGWSPPILEMDYNELKNSLKDYSYKDIYELVRWRLYERTGGGLMAELGSHQLDACSIFLGHVHPLSVHGSGVHSFFGVMGMDDRRPNPREIDDGIFLTFEFPGRNHPQGANKGNNKNDVVVVTYSSISNNGFENYGECVTGSRGTMLVEKEQTVALFPENAPGKKGDAKSTTVGVTTTAGKPALDAGGTWGPSAPAAAGAPGGVAAGASAAPPSRGYREEMEDFAYCVRLWDPKQGYRTTSEGQYVQRLPRCHGKVAMADAIIAMTANVAMKTHQRIEFKQDWFEPEKKDAVPESMA
jgi:predicted dehydrogenase